MEQIDPIAGQARARLAGLLGVAEHDLVFTPNTTHGLNICAQGIAWRMAGSAMPQALHQVGTTVPLC